MTLQVLFILSKTNNKLCPYITWVHPCLCMKTDLSGCLVSDKFREDLLRRRGQVGGGFEVLVVLARNPELDVFLAELRLEELAETLPANWNTHALTY